MSSNLCTEPLMRAQIETGFAADEYMVPTDNTLEELELRAGGQRDLD